MAANRIQGKLVGAIFTGVELNVDPESEAAVAVSLSQRIVLLRLDDDGSLHEIRSIDTDLHPVTLSGDVIALDDNVSQTLIYNWKTDERARLDGVDDAQHDHCLQVIFTSSTVLVVRTHSIGCALPRPSHTRSYTLLWLGGLRQPNTDLHPPERQPLGIRAKLAGALFSLLFPHPHRQSIVATWSPSMHRCHPRQRATAVWIRPHDRSMITLRGAQWLRDAHRSCIPRPA
ncbi:hypothetical protein ARMSODRAFT_1089930 [Armillaria solidipes]|uniref:Cleavage/polyadenylation specificity factor A subunit N-terminal domain-containing protein n=1 Tax=Armillaria solidipes TaxID=1076256 RepID=A0A2H3AWI9_9AGAR|nr:hypothetical protein ARMSODRAFT_1089930 [Armillaria solidipes]